MASDEAGGAVQCTALKIPVVRHASGRPRKKGRGIGRGLRQSIRRLAAGQRVLMALASCGARAKPIGTQTCASSKRPVSVRRGRAHKDGLDCNRGSTQDITGSRIRHDGSNDRVALLRLTEELHQALAQEDEVVRRSSAKGLASKRRSTAICRYTCCTTVRGALGAPMLL